jgi:hypothetical protein
MSNAMHSVLHHTVANTVKHAPPNLYPETNLCVHIGTH